MFATWKPEKRRNDFVHLPPLCEVCVSVLRELTVTMNFVASVVIILLIGNFVVSCHVEARLCLHVK